MKVTTTVEKEVTHLNAFCGVRYWEDAEVNGIEDEDGDLIPCRDGDNWCPIIDLESGCIVNWDKGIKASLHYKVCDEGIYQLTNVDGEVIKEIEGYVPDIMCPKDEGYGDYVIMDIDENGFIQDFKPTLKGF